MALAKRIKIGGGYFKGHVLAVASDTGSYVLVMTNDNAVINGISITPDAYGVGDTMKLEHRADIAGTGRVISILAEDINNIGANAVVGLDLPSAEPINSDESLVLTYINTAGVAMNVYTIVEYIGINKTS